MRKLDTATRAKLREGRKLWRPKRPEVKAQCDSCPFKAREDLPTFKRFHEKLKQLAKAANLPEPSVTRARIAIEQILAEDARSGEFYCHQSVYSEGATRRSPQDWLQCKGASDWYRSLGDLE